MIYVCYSLPSTFSFVREVILASRKDINQHVIFTDTWGIFYFDGLRFVICETFSYRITYYRCTSHPFGWGWVQVRSMIGCCFFVSSFLTDFDQTTVTPPTHRQYRQNDDVTDRHVRILVHHPWCLKNGVIKRNPTNCSRFWFRRGLQLCRTMIHRSK